MQVSKVCIEFHVFYQYFILSKNVTKNSILNTQISSVFVKSCQNIAHIYSKRSRSTLLDTLHIALQLHDRTIHYWSVTCYYVFMYLCARQFCWSHAEAQRVFLRFLLPTTRNNSETFTRGAFKS